MAAALQPEPATSGRINNFELPTELQYCLHRASDLVHRRREALRGEPLPTSVTALDRLLGGGLPRGGLVELVGRGSCGRFAALMAALRAVTGAGEAAALVDQGSQLDPQAAAAAGIDLERLLWLRPRDLGDALAASELLLHTGFSLVTLDLGLPPVRGRAPLAAWLRLARAAAAHGAAVLVGSPYRLSGCAAVAVLSGCRGRAAWSGAGPMRLLEGLRAQLQLGKRSGHPGLGEAILDLAVPEASFGPAVTRGSEKDHISNFEFRISNFPPPHPRSSTPSDIEDERSEKHAATV